MIKILYDDAMHPDIYYNCKFHAEHLKVLFVDDGDVKKLYVPGFEYLRAKEIVLGVEVLKLTDLKQVLQELKDDVLVPFSFPIGLADYLPDTCEVEKTLYPERLVKTDEEIHFLEEAQHVARNAIEFVVQSIRSGKVIDGIVTVDGIALTSEQLQFNARSHLLSQGYDCPELIIASGQDSSQPHNRGSGPIREGPVIIDIFPQSASTQYHGDMTRTVIIGSHETGEKMLQAVKEVAALCIEKCVPGMRASELYELSISELEKRGFQTNDETGMIHSLGHGVGLEIHEQPRLGPKDDIVLEEGMVVTVEPGLYYDVGVRHEDLVVVGKTPRVLGLEQK